MSSTDSVTAVVGGTPDRVFARVTDPTRLPEWNAAIERVVEAPAHLRAGSAWKVQVSALGRRWVSRSEVQVLHAESRRFAYRSQSDDGNASFADWEWRVGPHPGGSEVMLSVEITPRTFWRRHLLVHLRRPGLRREMRASLAALDRSVRDPSPEARPRPAPSA